MDRSAIHGLSGCRVNLDITRLLKEGTISQSEFEKLITFSKLGFKSIVFNIIFAISFTWICFTLLPGALLMLGLSLLFAPIFILLGLSSAQWCHPKLGFIIGTVLLIGLLLVLLLM